MSSDLPGNNELLALSPDGRLALTSYHSACIPDLVLQIQRLATVRTVTAVECRGVDNFVDDQLVNVIAQMSSITRLEFANQNVTEDQMERLMQLPNLQEIHLIRSLTLTERCAETMKNRIRKLEIVGCPCID